jgi:PAS domain S-box-containing protein
MKDKRKTKVQLIREPADLKKRVRQLEEAEAQRNSAEKALGNSEERLRRAHEDLEKRIRERTEELVMANEALQHEINERKAVQEALRESEERYRSIIETIQEGYFEVDLAGNMVFCNGAMCQIIGVDRSDLIGMNYRQYMDQNNARKVYKVFNQVYRTGKPCVSFAWQYLRKDGLRRDVESSVSLIRDASAAACGFRGIVRNVTDRRRAEEEHVKLEKLESIGVLAGGIAHDFNNILTAIQGNISVARLLSKRRGDAAARLEEAEKAAVRARDLTRQLLTFSKGGAPIKRTMSIADVVVPSCEFAVRGSNVRCHFDVSEDLRTIEADEGQINQVLSNLVINADHAMPEGGLIHVQAENVVLGAGELPPLAKGRYVRVSIKDRGIGIDAETLPRVFDPYFTTKPGGSGLGLTTAYSIARNHDGLITVESAPGLGSTFHVYLPASDKRPARQRVARTRIKAGTGKILLMDDEEAIRELAGDLLSIMGYEVETVADGAQAVLSYDRAGEAGAPFDLVILDLTVPGGMGGKEALERLLRLDRNVRAIVSSGYSNDPIMADYAKYGFSGVIPKPYNAVQLGEAVKRALAGSQAKSHTSTGDSGPASQGRTNGAPESR